eukprot:gene17170-52117_t
MVIDRHGFEVLMRQAGMREKTIEHHLDDIFDDIDALKNNKI